MIDMYNVNIFILTGLGLCFESPVVVHTRSKLVTLWLNYINNRQFHR